MREATFGRRNAVQRQPRRTDTYVRALPAIEADARDDVASSAEFDIESDELSPDEELQAWKSERRRERFLRLPWRQLWLMASLCFGIAAFVLPDSVNDAVDWLLWGLMGASFAASFLQKRRAAMA